MLPQTILEGLGLGALLVLVCTIGIHKGAVGRAHWKDARLREGSVAWVRPTRKRTRKNRLRSKLICVPGYLAYVLICVYAINGAQTFWGGFWQCFVILSVMNLIDRLGIDGYWVGHTKAWVIPGTEDLMPYISKSDKQKKWLFGTLGMAMISLLLAGLGLLL